LESHGFAGYEAVLQYAFAAPPISYRRLDNSIRFFFAITSIKPGSYVVCGAQADSQEVFVLEMEVEDNNKAIEGLRSQNTNTQTGVGAGDDEKGEKGKTLDINAMIRAAMVEMTTRMEIKLAERDRNIEKLQDDMA
jgi:hypothetical protein